MQIPIPGFRTALLLVAAVSASAQVPGSPYEPQIAELVLEARVPLSNLITSPSGTAPLPDSVLAQLQSGQLEMRGRIEYNRAARVFRIWQMLVPAGTPLPQPQSPPLNAPNIPTSADVSVDSIRWSQFVKRDGGVRQAVIVIGRVITRHGAFGSDPGDTLLFSFGFERPDTVTFLTVHAPGEVAVVAQQVAGVFRMADPLVQPLVFR